MIQPTWLLIVGSVLLQVVFLCKHLIVGQGSSCQNPLNDWEVSGIRVWHVRHVRRVGVPSSSLLQVLDEHMHAQNLSNKHSGQGLPSPCVLVSRSVYCVLCACVPCAVYHHLCVLAAVMSKAHSDSSDDFEFIETPAAPSPQPPSENCGVRTTAVGSPSPGGEATPHTY